MVDDSARAFWVTGPGRGEIRAAPLAPPGPDEVRVRTLYSGVSRGTEALVFAARVPESQYDAMRAPYQEGAFPAPVKYGYANVGHVEAGPPGLEGRTVFCLYPHQDRYTVPAAAVVPVPDGVPPGRAILAANMETAVNGLWDAGPRVGDRIAIVGAGTLGCLLAALAGRIPGARVTLVDPAPARADIAAALGVGFAAPDAAPGAQDLVIHTSGAPDGLAAALGLAGFEATVVEMSWFGDRAVPLPLGEAFHANRLAIRSSQVGAVAPARRARWDRTRRLALALSLLADARLDRLITGDSPFEALPEIMPALAAGAGRVLCHRITYGEAE